MITEQIYTAIPNLSIINNGTYILPPIVLMFLNIFRLEISKKQRKLVQSGQEHTE